MTILGFWWPVFFMLVAVTCIATYIAVRIAMMAVSIVWRALVHGMEGVIEAAGPAIGGFFVQIGAIALCAVGRGLSAVWSPVQARINGVGEKVSGGKPDTPLIADQYAEAVAVLGLPDRFTQKEVEENWKMLMRSLHSDLTQGRSNWIATRINTVT